MLASGASAADRRLTASCAFRGAGISGTLGQSGQFGTVVGTYDSRSGGLGNATVSAMNVQVNALTATVVLNSTNFGSQSAGYLAGIRSLQ